MKTLFDALVQKKKDSFGLWHIECPISLWGVSGRNKKEAEREAAHYFYQYLEDGEYDELMKRYGMES